MELPLIAHNVSHMLLIACGFPQGIFPIPTSQALWFIHQSSKLHPHSFRKPLARTSYRDPHSGISVFLWNLSCLKKITWLYQNWPRDRTVAFPLTLCQRTLNTWSVEHGGSKSGKHFLVGVEPTGGSVFSDEGQSTQSIFLCPPACYVFDMVIFINGTFPVVLMQNCWIVCDNLLRNFLSFPSPFFI